MRTIWVAIRGINYTDKATREVGNNLSAVVKAEQRIQQQAIMMLSAGVMWTVFASLAVTALQKVMASSNEGARILNQFNRATQNLMRGLGDAFAKVLGPSMAALGAFFNIVAKNPMLLQMAAALATVAVALVAIKGVSMIATGAFDMVMMKTVQMGLLSAGSANTMTASFVRLQLALGPIVMGLTIGSQMAAMLGKNAWVLIPVIGALTAVFIGLAVALHHAAMWTSILTFGAAAIAGVGAMVYAQSQAPSYQMGTRFAKQTGPAWVHQGEQITSTREKSGNTTPVTQQTVPFTKGKTEISMSIGTIQTKADKEQLKPLILKVVREALDNKT